MYVVSPDITNGVCVNVVASQFSHNFTNFLKANANFRMLALQVSVFNDLYVGGFYIVVKIVV